MYKITQYKINRNINIIRWYSRFLLGYDIKHTKSSETLLSPFLMRYHIDLTNQVKVNYG